MSDDARAQGGAAPEQAQFADRAVAVAHELNNILTVVRTYAHFARQARSPEQRTRDLRVVAAAAERGAALTDWLGSPHEPRGQLQEATPSRELLSTIALRLQLLLTPNATLDILPGDDLTFFVNRSRLEHVIGSLVLTTNLALSGGNFTFAVERKRRVDSNQPNDDERAALVIGCRAPAESGAVAEGGLVAAQVAGVAELLTDLLSTMQGTLNIVELKQGATRFEIELPLTAASRSPRISASRALSDRHATVLVVEDDAAIRLAMRRTLTDAGHLVLEASDGPAAEQIMANVGLTLDLVVSDLVLPRGSGPELFASVRAHYPNAAFLMVSGREREGARKASEIGAEFLGKPFYPAEFMAVVRRTLAAFNDRARRAGNAAEPPVVLIVDADADLRDSLALLLRECDFETHVAKSGLHAVQVLSERRVDAVVTDQLMLGPDGIALLPHVLEHYPDCTLILCTHHPTADVVVGADGRRAHRVLVKTMHPVALRDEIERVVLDARETRVGTR